MNSMILHKYEKWFYRFFFPFILLLFLSVGLYFLDKESAYFLVISNITKVFLLASILMNFYMTHKTKSWRKRGRELTEEIGLKQLIVLEGHLPSRNSTDTIEVHHNLAAFSNGFSLRKKPRQQVLDEMKQELKEDFKKLYDWKLNNNKSVLFMTTTHKSLATIWKRASNPYFYMKQADKMYDPLVEMNLIQWIGASFATTGRFSIKPPKEWDSYFFFISDTKLSETERGKNKNEK